MSIGTRKKVLDFKKMLNNDIESDNNLQENGPKFQKPKSKRELKKNALSTDLLGKKRKNQAQAPVEQKEKISTNHDKNILLTKDDYKSILSNYSDEIKYLNFTQTDPKNNSSLTTDLAKLNYNLFLCTKFENSKPYKMLDYIISNDNLSLNRPKDKDRFEEMKKQIFLKTKNDSNEKVNVLYKSLYEYFKTDFSSSYLANLFDEINKKIQNKFNKTIKDKNASQFQPQGPLPASTGGSSVAGPTVGVAGSMQPQEKKDKFTYSNLIIEKLRNSERISLLSYTSDADFVKSLIYLNNKFNKYLNKKNYVDKALLAALKSNLDFMNQLEQSYGEEEKSFLKDLLKNKKIMKNVYKNFSSFISCIKNSKSMNISKGVFNELIEIVSKVKEDEFDKIAKMLTEKTKTKFDKSKVKSLWVCIKFLFHLQLLTQPAMLSEYTENTFWKGIFSFLKSNTPKTQTKQSSVDNISVSQTSKSKSPKRKKRKNTEDVKPVEEKVDEVPPTVNIKDTIIERFDKGEDVFLVIRDQNKAVKKPKLYDKKEGEAPLKKKEKDECNTVSSKTISDREDDKAAVQKKNDCVKISLNQNGELRINTGMSANSSFVENGMNQKTMLANSFINSQRLASSHIMSSSMGNTFSNLMFDSTNGFKVQKPGNPLFNVNSKNAFQTSSSNIAPENKIGSLLNLKHNGANGFKFQSPASQNFLSRKEGVFDVFVSSPNFVNKQKKIKPRRETPLEENGDNQDRKGR